MTTILKKPFTRRRSEAVVDADKYIDLGDLVFDDEAALDGETTMVKVAEVFRYEDVSGLTNEVYDGNILIVDYSAMAGDQSGMRRLVEELQMVTRDSGGDVAGIGKNLLMVTPLGIRISRQKVKGGF